VPGTANKNLGASSLDNSKKARNKKLISTTQKLIVNLKRCFAE
jgi:hypothetical protein